VESLSEPSRCTCKSVFGSRRITSGVIAGIISPNHPVCREP
jgi:hypothetical protein